MNKHQEVVATNAAKDIPKLTEALRESGWVITRIDTFKDPRLGRLGSETYIVFLHRVPNGPNALDGIAQRFS